MSVLEFVFRDGWTFLGTLLLLYVAVQFRPVYIDKSTNYKEPEDDYEHN